MPMSRPARSSITATASKELANSAALRWLGLGYDGKVITGWAALAEHEDQIPSLIEDLKRSRGVSASA